MRSPPPHRRLTATRPALVVALVSVLGGPISGARADRRPLTDLLPNDVLVAYIAKPYAGLLTPAASTRPDDSRAGENALSAMLSLLNAGGLIPDEGQVYVDIATALPLLGDYEHGMALLDVSTRVVNRSEPAASQPDDVSLRLKTLQAALVLRVGNEHRAVLEHLSRVIGRYTNEDVAHLASHRAGPWSYQQLGDQRLPGWAVWEWGRIDDFFVISFGEDAFKRIAAAYESKQACLSHDPWFESAMKKTSGYEAFAKWYLGLARLEQRLGAAAQSRYHRVMTALSAAEITQDLWTIGSEGRALSWFRCYRQRGEDVVCRYSDPRNYPPEHRAIVPDQAPHYAIIQVPTSWLVDNLPRAWVASQSVGSVQTWQRAWRTLEQETGVAISDNLINNFGNNVVLFDYPPHPLRIPFALTFAIEIKDAKAVRTALDSLLTAWSRYLDERAERKGTTLVRVKVMHAPDDVWYLQAGILGPAMKVTDRYIVVSWSPQALRQVLPGIEKVEAGVAAKGQ